METVMIVHQPMPMNVPNVQQDRSSTLTKVHAVPVQPINTETQMVYAPIVIQSVSLAVVLTMTLLMMNVFAIMEMITSLLLKLTNALMNAPLVSKKTVHTVTVSFMFYSNQIYRKRSTTDCQFYRRYL